MKSFEFLEHTADLKFRAFGESLEAAFSNAALALSNAFVGDQDVGSKIEREFEVSAGSLEVLVHDFLSELIFFFETEHYVASFVDEITISDKGEYVLVALLKGGWLDFKKHKVESEVKAVTYHDMFVGEKEGQWVIQVVCDI